MLNLILQLTADDVPYIPAIKPMLSGRANVSVTSAVPTTVFELKMAAEKHGAKGVICCSQVLLELLLPGVKKGVSLSNYEGSIIEKHGIEFLIIESLDKLMSVSYQKFVTSRFLDKFLAPDKWITEPPFKWELFVPNALQNLLDYFGACDLIAGDIETIRDDEERAIECISFTGCMFAGQEFAIRTVVVPFDSIFNVIFVRRICSLSVAKTFQNGKYDVAYLLRYGCPVTNYAFDTINLFHCWLAELPKDLGFISAMMVRSYSYHKTEGSNDGKYARYSYNAKDTYYTLLATLALLVELPSYAERNYLQEFPVTFPCILSEHTGIKWDADAASRQKEVVEASMDTELSSIRKMVANPYFNPSSPQQTVKLFAMLGSKDVLQSTPPKMDKVSNRHPLNAVILKKITKYRKDRKEQSSYYKEGVTWNGRVYYALNPFGTDTGRLSSRESQFWCGLQIQNIKRDDDNEEAASIKNAFISEDGFEFGEADFSQAEARGTAYISGDTKLIEAVDRTDRDFHGHNASAFFGLPYDSIVCSTELEKDVWVHKVINKAIRNTSKRTNHGANYNMGAGVLLDTMGIKAVLLACKLLGLPPNMPLLKVTQYLLDRYDATYPVVRGANYDKIKADIASSGFLVGATGWTRRCFGRPSINKRDLNSYAAHPPQSLNAMLLNRAYLNVFKNIWMKYPQDFRLCAQIHDSILFQYRIGSEFLAHEVVKQMHLPTPVTDIFGITRTLIVPVDLKGGARRWSELKPI